MKAIIPFLVVLAGCTLSPDDYADSRLDIECETCEGKGNFDCEQLIREDPKDKQGCDYDEEAARECLKGTWTCNEDTPPIVYPVGPAICENVWDCSDGGDGE